MRVKFTNCLAGNGFVWNVGDVVSLPVGEAVRLVAAGFADLAPDASAAEATRLVAAEFAAAKPQAGRRGGRRAASPAVPPVVPSVEPGSEPQAGGESADSPPA
ncbi:MAG TPA: hypothetical protein VD866_27020 [Urbifossiella sp.]|nr:hypothetical protein [Urbifossiella sp.]